MARDPADSGETEAAWTPERGGDGRVHPRDEAEVAATVRWASAHGHRVRVRGAGHSPEGSFLGDGPEDLVLSLSRMAALEVVDREERIVRVGAGIHLGRDPGADADGARERSLLHQLATRFGWTVSSTGGITHQALGGFLGTASAGGSLTHSFLDHVLAVRLVNGRGEVREFTASGGDGADPGLGAVLPHLGLLGVVVSVTLRCEPIFAIVGQEAIVDIPGAPIDFSGTGDSGRPSLRDFLTRSEYARIEWWPQRGGERLLIWQAQRVALQPGFAPTRYEEFTQYPVLAEALFSTIFVVAGNARDPARTRALLRRNASEVRKILDEIIAAGRMTRPLRLISWLLPATMRSLAFAAPLLRWLRPGVALLLPWLVPAALNVVLPLDDRKPGMRRREPQSFRDWSWEGLPMDNQANDVLLWTQFTELWVPLTRAEQLITLLREHFGEPARTRESYRRTGLYAFEVYGAPPSRGWIHPGHSDGEDEWAPGAVRLDVYWFQDNLEDPRAFFFPQFWELLRRHGVPFRCHWGKEMPRADADPEDFAWVAAQYPRRAEWLALRAECDPDGVFLTEYWRTRLGL